MAVATQHKNNGAKMPGGITGKGFVKGDPRINRNGRPRTFDELRGLAQSLAVEPSRKNAARDRATAILDDWSTSDDVAKQEKFLWVAYGKVPDKLEAAVTAQVADTALQYAKLRGVDADADAVAEGRRLLAHYEAEWRRAYDEWIDARLIEIPAQTT